MPNETPQLAAEPYPEHAKMMALGDRKNDVQEFIDWLFDDQRYSLAQTFPPVTSAIEGVAQYDARVGNFYWKGEGGQGLPLQFFGVPNREKLMAAFFAIDLQKLQDEKQAMLDALRGKRAEVMA